METFPLLLVLVFAFCKLPLFFIPHITQNLKLMFQLLSWLEKPVEKNMAGSRCCVITDVVDKNVVYAEKNLFAGNGQQN